MRSGAIPLKHLLDQLGLAEFFGVLLEGKDLQPPHEVTLGPFAERQPFGVMVSHSPSRSPTMLASNSPVFIFQIFTVVPPPDSALTTHPAKATERIWVPASNVRSNASAVSPTSSSDRSCPIELRFHRAKGDGNYRVPLEGFAPAHR